VRNKVLVGKCCGFDTNSGTVVDLGGVNLISNLLFIEMGDASESNREKYEQYSEGRVCHTCYI